MASVRRKKETWIQSPKSRWQDQFWLVSLNKPASSVDNARSSPENPKHADRVAEVRACLYKLYLCNSCNLKEEIKAEVTQCIDRVYQILRETEMERRMEKGKKVNWQNTKEGK